MEESEYELLAPKHWTVEKKKNQWDAELQHFRDNQKSRIQNIRASVRKSAAALHERIFFTLRWSNPRLPLTYHKYVLDYCHHLIGPEPTSPFPNMSVLEAWNAKLIHSDAYKVCMEVQAIYNRLRSLVQKRDDAVMKTIAKSIVTSDKMLITKDVQARWQMEVKHNQRDNYWNIWYLASHAKDAELARYLQTHNDINTPDPDCGLTALHYACKRNHFSTMKLLLTHGANERVRAVEDGRTPLHFGAAYGSRNMVLELLAVGADFNAQDKYGYTALQLAVQNSNGPVVATLSNWNQLVPEICEEGIAKSADTTPLEFQTTPDEIFEKMSAPLRVITNRLDTMQHTGSASHDMELRLCQKRAEMCFAEQFIEEGMKSQKRRWLVAKQRCVRSDMSSLSDQYMHAIASELAECLVTYRTYEEAVGVLTDSLVYVKETALVLQILQRKCQILLYIYDNLSSRKEFIPALLAAESSAASLASNSTMSQPSSAVAESTDVSLAPGIETTPAYSTSILASSLRLSDTAPSRLQHPSVHFPPILTPTPSQLTATSQNTPITSTLEDQLILIAWSTIHECMQLFHATYSSSSVFVEPVELAVILELASDVKDRQHETFDAYDYMQHAAIIRERQLGQSESSTVSTMIQQLRLLIHKTITTVKLQREKSESDSFKAIGLFATEVSRRLDRLTIHNAEAAQKLSSDCYKLVALAELIASGEVDLRSIGGELNNRKNSRANVQILRHKMYSSEHL